MNIYSYLKKDHRKVETLFEKIAAAKNVITRKNLYKQMIEELTVHADTEKATFYKTLLKYSTSKDEAKHGDEEHHEIKTAIRKLNLLSIKSNEWLVQLGVLKKTVLHHVKDEEGEMFDAAKKVLSNKQANELAIEMDELKQKKLGKKASKLSSMRQKLVNKLEKVF